MDFTCNHGEFPDYRFLGTKPVWERATYNKKRFIIFYVCYHVVLDIIQNLTQLNTTPFMYFVLLASR
jgi:hypothetical protein